MNKMNTQSIYFKGGFTQTSIMTDERMTVLKNFILEVRYR